jgi:hypothetical protein
MGLRTYLYALARFLGDVNAIIRGTFFQRLIRRKLLSSTASIINRIS